MPAYVDFADYLNPGRTNNPPWLRAQNLYLAQTHGLVPENLDLMENPATSAFVAQALSQPVQPKDETATICGLAGGLFANHKRRPLSEGKELTQRMALKGSRVNGPVSHLIEADNWTDIRPYLCTVSKREWLKMIRENKRYVPLGGRGDDEQDDLAQQENLLQGRLEYLGDEWGNGVPNNPNDQRENQLLAAEILRHTILSADQEKLLRHVYGLDLPTQSLAGDGEKGNTYTVRHKRLIIRLRNIARKHHFTL